MYIPQILSDSSRANRGAVIKPKAVLVHAGARDRPFDLDLGSKRPGFRAAACLAPPDSAHVNGTHVRRQETLSRAVGSVLDDVVHSEAS